MRFGMRVRPFVIGAGVLAAGICFLGYASAVAAEAEKPATGAAPKTSVEQVGTQKSGGAKPNLTESDCRNLGGTVVQPNDDRCGAMNATYCRTNDGNAACIDHQ